MAETTTVKHFLKEYFLLCKKHNIMFAGEDGQSIYLDNFNINIFSDFIETNYENSLNELSQKKYKIDFSSITDVEQKNIIDEFINK
jgi:hypothetical protein